jgi:hypothetical protein
MDMHGLSITRVGAVLVGFFGALIGGKGVYHAISGQTMRYSRRGIATEVPWYATYLEIGVGILALGIAWWIWHRDDDENWY